MLESIPFQVPHGEHTLIGDVLGGDLPIQVLMLHGAGQSHRGRLAPLRAELVHRGIGSCAFDFVGHGQTGGDLSMSSLADRAEQAQAVIEHHGLSRRPLMIIAASMSAHTAVGLTGIYSVEALVLIVPAMYATEAYNLRFDGGFSEVIRRPESWRDSDGWDQLARFTGRLLIVAGEDDRVIPPEVVRLYRDRANAASVRRLHVVRGGGHMLFTELRERDPGRLEEVLDQMEQLLRMV